MINLAVIELKDIVKYLIKITLVIVIVVLLTKFFSGFKTKLNTNKSAFLSCLDTVIPSIKTVNKKQENTSKSSPEIKPLKLALELELGMIDSIKRDEIDNEEINVANEDSNSVNNENIEDSANVVSNTTNEENIEEAKTDVKTQVLDSNVPEKYTSEYNGVKIRNETDNIKLTKEMLKPDIDINTKNILIYHTHTCESYTPTKNYTYTESGNFRTKDLNCNMVRVGDELEKYLKHYGFKVTHDRTIYDSSYSQSYDRSLKGVAKLLDEDDNKETEILFDIHRDAIGDSSYAPTVKIGEEEAAQLMFVIGSNGGGSTHDNWNDNLKFAIKIQEKANELYPGLFKPIILRDSRYNQHLAKGASIIEVGATGNTMEQCLTSMKYLSKVLSEVLK